LTKRAERQGVRISKIVNDCLARYPCVNSGRRRVKLSHDSPKVYLQSLLASESRWFHLDCLHRSCSLTGLSAGHGRLFVLVNLFLCLILLQLCFDYVYTCARLSCMTITLSCAIKTTYFQQNSQEFTVIPKKLVGSRKPLTACKPVTMM